MENVYPTGIIIKGKTVEIAWSDGKLTSATPSGKDRFSLETGVLWALGKKFISTSKIVNAVFTGTYFLEMPEQDMLWHVVTKFMDQDDILKVIQAAR